MQIFKISSFSMVYILFLFFFTGCGTPSPTNPPNPTPTPIVQQRETITFNGLKVLLKPGVPKTVLTNTTDDYKNMLHIENPSLFQTVNGEEMVNLTLENLNSLVESFIQNYPNFETLAQKDVEIIRSDFFNIPDNQIITDIEKIKEIYRLQSQYELFKKLSKTTASAQYYISIPGFADKLTVRELFLYDQNPRFVQGTYLARVLATSYTISKFKQCPDGTIQNSFLHSIWNVLIAKYNGELFDTVSGVLAWTKAATDAHEPVIFKENNTYMDLHNNAEGRTYFQSIARIELKSGGLFNIKHPIVVAASDTEIIDYLYRRALDGERFSNKDDLPQKVGKLVNLIDDPNMGIVKGTVSDAITRSNINGADIICGDFKIKSDTNGNYALLLPINTQQVTYSYSGYFGINRLVQIQSGVPQNEYVSLSPTVPIDQLRIILTWGETPSDLDAHLFAPNNIHIYHANKGSISSTPFIYLNYDYRYGYGPETITIYQFSPGTYTYSVNRYSSGILGNSKARVEIYNENGLIKSYTVPNDSSTSLIWWNVFKIDGTTKVITDINQLSNVSASSFVQCSMNKQ